MNCTVLIHQTGEAIRCPAIKRRLLCFGMRMWARLFARRLVIVFLPSGAIDKITIKEKGGNEDDSS